MNLLKTFSSRLALAVVCSSAVFFGGASESHAQITNGYVDVQMDEAVAASPLKFYPANPKKLKMNLKILVSGQVLLKDTAVSWETPTTRFEFITTNAPTVFKTQIINAGTLTGGARIVVKGSLKITTLSSGAVKTISNVTFDDLAVGSYDIFDAFGKGSHTLSIYSSSTGRLQVMTYYLRSTAAYNVGPDTYNLVSP